MAGACWAPLGEAPGPPLPVRVWNPRPVSSPDQLSREGNGHRHRLLPAPGYGPALSTAPDEPPWTRLGKLGEAGAAGPPHPCRPCQLLPPRPTGSASSLQAPVPPLLIMRKPGDPAKGLPLPHRGAGGNEAAIPNPSPRERIVVFGARSEGQRGSPTGSVRRDQVGLVCLCLFVSFF